MLWLGLGFPRVYDIIPFVETCLIITFGLGGPDFFNANLSEFDRQLKGTSFKDTTELHGTVAIWKVVCDLIEDVPCLSLLSYVRRICTFLHSNRGSTSALNSSTVGLSELEPREDSLLSTTPNDKR